MPPGTARRIRVIRPTPRGPATTAAAITRAPWFHTTTTTAHGLTAVIPAARIPLRPSLPSSVAGVRLPSTTPATVIPPLRHTTTISTIPVATSLPVLSVHLPPVLEAALIIPVAPSAAALAAAAPIIIPAAPLVAHLQAARAAALAEAAHTTAGITSAAAVRLRREAPRPATRAALTTVAIIPCTDGNQF